MYGCSYGCPDWQLTADHPLPKPSEFEEFASEFEKVGGFFPNVIGAMDGLYIEMELTEERRFEPSFINYKQFHSLHFQISSVPKNLIFCTGQSSQHKHRGVLVSVKFGCFSLSRFSHFHCNTMRKAIKAHKNLHTN